MELSNDALDTAHTGHAHRQMVVKGLMYRTHTEGGL